jgi:hypothetical protein
VVRETYLKQVQELCEFYRTGLAGAGADYQLINTRQPYDAALSAYLGRRAKMRK